MWLQKAPRELGVLSGALLAAMQVRAPPGIDWKRDADRLRLVTEAAASQLPVPLEDAGLLREYQAQAVAAMLSAPLGRSIVELPTGAGKTRVIAACLACAAIQLDIGRAAVVVPSPQLARQVRAELDALLPEMLVKLPAKEVQFTYSVHTYGSLEAEDAVDMLIVDECHRAAAPTHATSLGAVAAPFRIGLSATPLDRQDVYNALVVGLTGPVVYSVTLEQLVEAGHLTPGVLN